MRLNFFSAPTTVRTKAIFNNFGGAIGGPVYIPKLFNGRKHLTFFFTDWEDTLEPKGSLTNTDVPTAAELQGNFSGPTPQNTAPLLVYDPSTTATVNGKVTRSAISGKYYSAKPLRSGGGEDRVVLPGVELRPDHFQLLRGAHAEPHLSVQYRSSGREHQRLRPGVVPVRARRPDHRRRTFLRQRC